MIKINLNCIAISFVLVSSFAQAVSINDENLLLAAVSLAETKPQIPKEKKVAAKKKKIEQYEVQGYVQDKYVRFVIELINGKEIKGHMFVEQGDESYVYGEYIDGTLHIYDMKGEHFIVLTQ